MQPQTSNLEVPSEDHLQVQLENLQINENALEPNSEEYDSEWESSSDDDNEMIFQLKIVLKGVTPKIWRRIQVPSCDTFEDLHDYIQEAMGWRCCHLHQFQLPDGTVVMPDDMQEFGDNSEAENESDLELHEVFTQIGFKVMYVYDMGDWWEHEVVLEKILPEQEDIFYPRCIGGKRACPPEDCGGAHGYMHLLKVIADPSHKEHHELTAWLEDMYPGFNPKKFNKDKVFNSTLYLDLEKFESSLIGPN